MASLRNWLFLLEKVLDDSLAVGVVPYVFRRPATGDYDRRIFGGIHVFERDVGIPAIARFFGVSVITRLEIVDDKVQFLLRRCCDFHVVAFFEQPLIWIYNLERLA